MRQTVANGGIKRNAPVGGSAERSLPGIRGGGTRDRVRRRDRLKGHPQERQHSAAEGGTRDRVPPARSTNPFARGIVTERPRPAFRLRDLRGSVSAALAARVEPGWRSRDAPGKPSSPSFLKMAEVYPGQSNPKSS
jgi:hypothetical protein